MPTNANETAELRSAVREAIANCETNTGHVAFPDWNRVQIVLSDGEMGVDVPNALEPFGWAHITFIRKLDDEARIVEFEK